MKEAKNSFTNWSSCTECQGRGKKSQRIRKKVKLRYLRELDHFEQMEHKSKAPIKPKGHLYTCPICKGTGLLASSNPPLPDYVNLPQVAIIGGGIGGIALAVACLHRGIPFTIFERDANFEARSQGYGLTLQQASKAIKALGIKTLEDGVVSTKHVVHTPEGTVVGEWGVRKWLNNNEKIPSKHSNIHIARQALRAALLHQLNDHANVQWNYKLIDIKSNEEKNIDLFFQVDGEEKKVQADIVVGADGIRSTVRKALLGEESYPLRYLDCIVILGICDLKQIAPHPLLDGETVFQTANGTERIYMMPFSKGAIMWQLSFPMKEEDAKKLSAKGAQALKEEALIKTQWHEPIPQIINNTATEKISGYPVYDRDLIKQEDLKELNKVTLIGDAAHPMSPFKGQGANQALLDALSLAREIARGCSSIVHWKKDGVRENALNTFEQEMLARSSSKVKDSAKAAKFLHSDVALHQSNAPRGKFFKED